MGVRVFPVRHHSPAAARCLIGFLDEARPKAVLIEGPTDADGLIDAVVDAGTEPPVALLSYLPGGSGIAVLHPFADYSPEYVALREARRRNIPVAFCDIPAAATLARLKAMREAWEAEAEKALAAEAAGEKAPSQDALEGGPEQGFWERVGEASGYESFHEFWDTAFEIPAHSTADYVRLTMAFGRLARESRKESMMDPEEWDRVRERHMRAAVDKLVASGLKPEEIVVVCGAFHGPAFEDGDFLDGSMGPAPADARMTLIPYSYPRLAQQRGYASGNRAPRYYGRVQARGGDFGQTTMETLIGLGEQLRLRGHNASLADIIDAYRLANILARMREKAGPGLEEVRESAVACMAQGQELVIGQVWDGTVVGTAVGKVSARIARTSLQEEFHTEVENRRIPATDEAAEFWLTLTLPGAVDASIFLHRLGIAGVPFARTVETATGPNRLSRAREKWETQWTPSTEMALVERVVLGETIAQVCVSLLRAKLKDAQGVAAASEVLLDAAVCDLPDLYADALTRVEHASTAADDFAALATASQNIAALLAYGTTRKIDPAQLKDLLARLIHRAATALHHIGKPDQEGADLACNGLKTLFEVARAHAKGDAMVDGALRWAAGSSTLHPQVAGLAASLLHLSKTISDEELEAFVRLRIGAGADPLESAQYLGGMLSVNRVALVKNRAIIAFLDGIITGMPFPQMVELLPVFRRALSGMSRSELSYLLEHVFAIHGVAARKEGATLVTRKDIDQAREADADLKSITDKWDDMF